MNLLELADTVKARAATGTLQWFDGEPDDTAGSRYMCLYTEAGNPVRSRYTATAGDLRWGFSVVCAATTEDGLRAAIDTCRALFEGFRLDPSPAASPLSEVASGPRLKSGPAGDQRLSQTLIYQMHTSRSINV